MVDWEKLGVAGLIIVIIVALIIVFAWVWVCFIAAGAILTWVGFSSEGFLAVQIVLTMVILGFCAMMERIGRKILS